MGAGGDVGGDVLDSQGLADLDAMRIGNDCRCGWDKLMRSEAAAPDAVKLAITFDHRGQSVKPSA